MKNRKVWPGIAAATLSLALAACDKQAEAPTKMAEPEKPAKTVKGVDTDKQVLFVGVLNDESGPAAAIGKPYAVGKRLLAAQVNGGNSGLVPQGWSLKLIERDHGYNPQRSVQAYNEIKEDVLYIGTSFGTPNTLPLLPLLERDKMVAFPASLSSKMSENNYTPPLGTPYKVEAMRAMDWVVEQAGSAEAVKAGIIYQQDDYGADGLAGWTAAAEHHGVSVVSQQEVAPGQSDYTAVVTALKEAGATHVLLTTLPSGTGPIVGTAAQLKYMPVWVGSTPAWIDRFFDPEVIPSAVFANFYWVMGLPYWGEDLPGMAEFIQLYEQLGAEMSPPDFYILTSYVQGVVQLKAFTAMVKSGDISREGYLAALQKITNFSGGGLFRPVDLSKFPYQTGTETRILKPDFENRTWVTVAPYAEPALLAAAADSAAPGAADLPGDDADTTEAPAAE